MFKKTCNENLKYDHRVEYPARLKRALTEESSIVASIK